MDAFEEIFALPQQASAAAPLCAPGRLLDIGAGAGEISSWLASRCGMCVRAYDLKSAAENMYTLLDPKDKRWGALARQHFRTFTVSTFDGRAVPERGSASYDVVLLNMMLHHAAANAPALMAEAARLTRRYALVFEDISIPDNAQVVARHKVHDSNGTFRSIPEWRRIFRSAGFATAHVGTVGSRALGRRFPRNSLARLDYLYQRYFLLQRAAV